LGAKGWRQTNQPFAGQGSDAPAGSGVGRANRAGTKKPAPAQGVGFMGQVAKSLLFFLKTQVLYIDSLLQRDTLLHGRLLEVLAGTHLADSSGFLELALEFLKGSFDVFTFFDGNDNHAFTPPFFKNGLQR
jgi:hypothetical protein